MRRCKPTPLLFISLLPSHTTLHTPFTQMLLELLFMKHGVPSVTVSSSFSEKYSEVGRQCSSQGCTGNKDRPAESQVKTTQINQSQYFALSRILKTWDALEYNVHRRTETYQYNCCPLLDYACKCIVESFGEVHRQAIGTFLFLFVASDFKHLLTSTGRCQNLN